MLTSSCHVPAATITRQSQCSGKVANETKTLYSNLLSHYSFEFRHFCKWWSGVHIFCALNVFIKYILYFIHKNTVRETDDRVLLYWAQMNTTIWQSEKKTGAELITCLSIIVLYWLYGLWLYANGFWKTQGNALLHTCPVICCEYCHVNCIVKIQQSQAPNWDLSIF